LNTNTVLSDRHVRLGLLGITLLLIAFGIIMIFSASAIFADHRYGDSLFFLKRHMIFLVIGFMTLCAILMMRIEVLERRALLIFIVTCIVLATVAIIAQPMGGARRWIQIGPFSLQPSEFAKIAIVIYLAKILSKRDRNWKEFKVDLLPLLWPVGLVCLLILIGKDLGTTVVIGAVFLVTLFVARLPIRYFLWLVGGAVPLFVLAVLIEPYRVQRIVSFLNPWKDIQNTGFQLYQSLLAIGSGGMFGVGLGHSQQKLFYLPAAHTDFIFSIIGEEMGFIGAGFVLLLFACFLFLGAIIIRRTKSLFTQYLSLGLVSLITFEALINMGVSVGVLPTKGLALPFISYGGSSLVAKMVLVGLLLNISKSSEESRL